MKEQEFFNEIVEYKGETAKINYTFWVKRDPETQEILEYDFFSIIIHQNWSETLSGNGRFPLYKTQFWQNDIWKSIRDRQIKEAKIRLLLQSHVSDMQTYSYHGSNPGISENSFDSLVNDIKSFIDEEIKNA